MRVCATALCARFLARVQAAKAAQEAALEALLAELDVDLIVMARYMQARTLCMYACGECDRCAHAAVS
jgi:formyltetrahydrofolate hydrolase